MGDAVQAYLGLGTNRGDRVDMLRYASQELGKILSEIRLSPVYETDPLHYEEQPRFLNAVVGGWCSLAPRELLEAVQGIEAAAGRSRAREIPKGPRTLDIDILLYGTVTVDGRQLTIPHPELTRRAFALKPLLDLDPGCLDPRSGRPFSEFLNQLPDQGIYLVTDSPYTHRRGEI
ncbi:MAG: 2-amino-4-hydroxy-6-hydroxymethyldihydropteridine diphosphokinase [Spirochaetota bacterium]